MVSAVLRKSITDLTRRKARAFFAISTLAIAVAAVGIFAVPPLAADQMDKEVAAARLADLTVRVRSLALSGEQLAELARLPNIEAVEARSLFATRVSVGARRAEAVVMGVRDFARQRVDVVSVPAGRAPPRDALLTEVQNGLAGRFEATTGDTARLFAADGQARNLRISGVGRNLEFASFSDLPEVRPAGTWPGQDEQRSILHAEEGVTDFWVATASDDHTRIHRAATRIEDVLRAAGYDPGTEFTYVAAREDEAENRTLTTTITVLGFLIVAISMVGLVSAITMSVLERTREIGILRCVGARGRDVRRIFATEGLVIALAGWLIGIPLGYLLDRLLVWAVGEVVNVEVQFAFPLSNLPLALVGTVVLALLIMLPPLRRAVRLRSGDALRYA